MTTQRGEVADAPGVRCVTATGILNIGGRLGNGAWVTSAGFGAVERRADDGPDPKILPLGKSRLRCILQNLKRERCLTGSIKSLL